MSDVMHLLPAAARSVATQTHKVGLYQPFDQVDHTINTNTAVTAGHRLMGSSVQQL